MNELEFGGGVKRDNPYRNDGPGITTGWDAGKNDVNGLNVDGLRPIEVAAKALDLDEFLAIASHPDFNPLGVDPRRYADQSLNTDLADSQSRFAALVEPLELIEQTVAAIRGQDPEASTLVPPESQLDNGLPSVASPDNPVIATVDGSSVAANDANPREPANDPDRFNGVPRLEPDMARVNAARQADREAVQAQLNEPAEATRKGMHARFVAMTERLLGIGANKSASPVPGAEKPSEPTRTEAGKKDGKGEDNELKAAPVFAKSGYAVPDSVVAQYVRFDGKFLDRKTEVVHFVDSGRKLETDSNDRQVIRNMVEVAKAKNWGELHLKGSEEFKREAWIAAELAGLKSTGFKPKPQDHALLQVAREEMRISAGERDAAATARGNTIAAVGSDPEKPDAKAQESRKDVPAPTVAEPSAPDEGPKAPVDVKAATAPETPAQAAGEPSQPTRTAQDAPRQAAAPVHSADDIQRAREQFAARGKDIQSQRTKGFDVLQEKTARIVLESRIKGLPKESQDRFRADFERQVATARAEDREIVVPVPRAERVLLEAARLADQGRAADQKTPEQSPEIDR